MALIKCAECGAEVSTEARACPHCGYPIAKARVEISTAEPPRSKSGIPWSSLLLLAVPLVLFGLWLFLDSAALHRTQSYDDFHRSAPPPAASLGTEVPLQEVKNLGYDFYLGQIEEPGINDITDDVKNQITKVVYDTHVPASLLKNTPIIILNNLALTGDQYIVVGRARLRVPDLKADFLSEGGLYAPYATSTAMIFINKSTLTSGQLSDVLARELGHAMGSTLTDSQWKTFYQLRNIPASTPPAGASWNLSPQEDFAEVYKNVFTGASVQTVYGFLEPAYGLDMTCDKLYQDVLDSYMPKSGADMPLDWLMHSGADYDAAAAKAAADPKVQACRREVLTTPAKWQFGMPPYKATVGPQTKQFIEALAASSSSL